MKLATTTGDFFSCTKSQAVALEHIRKAGFRYADYSFGGDYHLRNGVYSKDYEKHVEEIAQTAAELDITLVQAHSPMGTPLKDDDGSFLADTLRCVDACGAWKIPNLVVHSGYLRGLSIDETFERNKAFFLPLLERAEKYGVNILVENFNKMVYDDLYWIDNAHDLLRMVEYVDHPLFHAVWDVGHGNMQDMPQDEALRMLGGHLRALHIQDNRGDSDMHFPPFAGTMNLDCVMNGLLDIGYNGYFTFEVTHFFISANVRRKYAPCTRLASVPIEVRDAFEQYLYGLGKYVLESYECFEE